MNIKQMLVLQDRLNKVINPNWVTAGYAWPRAAMHEAVELQEHIGWKWWKKQEPNMAQARLELVDIWHFLLSHYIVRNDGDIDAAAGMIERRLVADPMEAATGLLDLIDTFVAVCADDRIHIGLFATLAQEIGLTPAELERIYIGKNVLNLFRQAHGYKQGTYVKLWHGHEDNVVLDDLMNKMPGLSADDLMSHLEEAYGRVVNAG